MAMPAQSETDESLCISDMFEREGETQLVDEERPRIEKIGDVEYLLRCAPNDGGSPGALFAYTVWSGSIQVAHWIYSNKDSIRDKSCVEFGAAAALPSLVALSHEAKFALITDFPSDPILDNIRSNVSANFSGLTEERVSVQGHLWGSPVPDNQCERFDIALVAECLWKHQQHEALLSSIDRFLRPGGLAVVSYAHHVPGMEAEDDAFFALAAARGFVAVEKSERLIPYMWNSSATTKQYLIILEKKSPSSLRQNSLVTPDVTDSELIESGGPMSDSDLDCTDSESLELAQVRRAQAIAKEEDEASLAPLVMPVDSQGATLPVLLPGPKAPRHPDHPAYGMRTWPPPGITQIPLDEPQWVQTKADDFSEQWMNETIESTRTTNKEECSVC